MNIRHAAVIGAGTMGAQIAAHLANVGIPTLLVDISTERGGERVDGSVVAREGFERALRLNPSPLMHQNRAQLVRFGSLDDLGAEAGFWREVDWVVEAVLEKLEVKQELWRKLEPVATRAILSSNSSGIPMRLQIEGRSEELRQRFVGTHFFNPVRYLHLLEVIPTPDTAPEVLETITSFATRILGKGVVVAKDVPGFIANRIGVFGMMRAIALMVELGLRPDVVDLLTGPLIGRPKSATLRTADLSGLDICLSVAKNLAVATRYSYGPPELLERLVGMNRLGEKTGEGFFKRVSSQSQSRQGQSGSERMILSINPETLEYEEPVRVTSSELELVRRLPSPLERLRAMFAMDNVYGEFVRRLTYDLLSFAADNIPEIADDPKTIDQALRWGFGWELGPFEMIEALGHAEVASALRAQSLPVPRLIAEPLSPQVTDSATDPGEPHAQKAPARDRAFPSLTELKRERTRIVKTSPGASLIDFGDGVALLEFHSKANTIGEDAVRMVQQAMQIVPEQFIGLIVGNEGEQFSAGANLAQLLMQAQAGEWDEIDLAVRTFQRMTTSLRYCPFPTVSAPFGLTLGGALELSLYADHVQAHAELYTGLVEAGVGLIPAGGGTTELLVRLSDALLPGEDPFAALQKAFEQIALAKTSSSALEARDLAYLKLSDGITMNRDLLLQDAKRRVLELARGYVAPQMRTDIQVLGENALAKLRLGIYSMVQARRASEYDAVVAGELARVLSGGAANRTMRVSTNYLLELEREAFLTLTGKRQTQERIAHTLKTGKPLRN